MKRTFIALAVLAQAAIVTSAFAAETTGPKTREQVIAEYEQARADGSFYIDAGDGTPRGLARARLAEREQRSKRDAQAVAEKKNASRAGS
ncbi:MAG: DUF4148 domain-containing protein [Piscinibacter sp.]|nr:DUF4148 domain-containing protein [Piscinibacter sp.]